MSTSSTYVKWAAVTFDFAILSKIRLRRPWIGIRSAAPRGATATEGAGDGAAPIAGPLAALRTSSSVGRPCGPLPRTAARFTFSSLARRRTAGAARTSPDGGGTEGTIDAADLVAGAGGSGDLIGGAGIGGETSPASPNTTSVLPTFTTSPSLARSWRILPVTGEGICTVTLSVMTSTIGSFSLTASPSFTNHLTTSPSWTPSPMSGSLNSRVIAFPRDCAVASPAAGLTVCTLGLSGGVHANHFMAATRCRYGEELGRGGVAQSGGRALCPALRAGKIPVLLLLSVSEGDAWCVLWGSRFSVGSYSWRPSSCSCSPSRV